MGRQAVAVLLLAAILPCARADATDAGAAIAAPKVQTVVEHVGSRYVVQAVGVVAAPPARVRAQILDFDHLARLHRAIVASHRLGAAEDGGERVHVETEFCLLIFCFHVLQIVDFRSADAADIVGIVEPDRGDLHYGRYHWRLAQAPGGRTRLSFDGVVEPAFWLPPLIGPWIIEHKLEDLFTGVAVNLGRAQGAKQS